MANKHRNLMTIDLLGVFQLAVVVREHFVETAIASAYSIGHYFVNDPHLFPSLHKPIRGCKSHCGVQSQSEDTYAVVLLMLKHLARRPPLPQDHPHP